MGIENNDFSPDWAYPCVGGPLDGQSLAQPAGRTWFRLAQLGRPPVTPYSDGAAPRKLMAPPTINYQLEPHPRYRLAWVCQNPEQVIK